MAMALVVLLALLCTGVAWAGPSTPTTSTSTTTTTSTAAAASTARSTPTTSTTAPLRRADINSAPEQAPSPLPFRSSTDSPLKGGLPTTTPPPDASSSPSPEQLVARIRSLVRALRDADQLLQALRVFRDQQGLQGDHHHDEVDAVLKAMKDDANRTLVAQVMQVMETMEDAPVASRDRLLTAMGLSPGSTSRPATPPSTAFPVNKISAKIPYSLHGKKSAKFNANTTKVAAVTKKDSLLRAKTTAIPPLSTSSRTPTTTTRTTLGSNAAPPESAGNGTVVTRVKEDPILGTYKVVIRDLTPAASAGIKPSRGGGLGNGVGRSSRGNKTSDEGARQDIRRKDMLLVIAPSSTPAPEERNRYRFQETLAAPSTTAATAVPSKGSGTSKASKNVSTTASLTASTTSPAATATRRSGKAASKPRNAAPVKGKTTTSTTTPASRTTASQNKTTTANFTSSSSPTSSTTTTTTNTTTTTTVKIPPGKNSSEKTASIVNKVKVTAGAQKTTISRKSFEKKAAGETQQVLLSATLRTASRAASRAVSRTAPADREDDAAQQRAPSHTPIIASIFPRYGPGAALPHVETPFVATGKVDSAPSNILLPPLRATAAPEDERAEQVSAGGGGPRQAVKLEPITAMDVPSNYFLGETPWVPIAAPAETTRPSETTVEVQKLKVIEATTETSSPFHRPPPTSPSSAPGQGRAVLNDALEWRPSRTWQYSIQQDRADINLQDLQDYHLQLQHDLPLSVAESMYYRLRPSDLQDPYDGIPGLPGLDYPAFSRPPITAFTCATFRRKGYFADPASGCQAFYVCHGDGRGEAMLCPNGTIFSQEVLVCDWWYNVDCK